MARLPEQRPCALDPDLSASTAHFVCRQHKQYNTFYYMARLPE